MGALFIYARGGEKKVLSFEFAQRLHYVLVADGWVHNCTVNPAAFLEHIVSLPDAEILEAIRGLFQKGS